VLRQCSHCKTGRLPRPIAGLAQLRLRQAGANASKKYGFVSLKEFDDISTNISMIMSGVDQQSRKFTEPKEQIRQQIAAIKSDKSIPEAEKKEDLAQLDAALKEAKPIQFKENITLVLKHFDKLFQLMQEERPGN
jgi:hypothetical protein